MDIFRPIFFSKIKDYIKLSNGFRNNLLEFPNDWPKYQKKFNLAVDTVYNDILSFMNANIETNQKEEQIYRLKKIFEKRYRRYFLYGDSINWCYQKPFGYAGDFKIIEDIYRQSPVTVGFDRLWDNYFQQLSASVSIRERKEDFKQIITDFVKNRQNKNIRIMSLASGPAREIKELLNSDKADLFERVEFDCYDSEIQSIEYAKNSLNCFNKVDFYQKNAIRLALKKNINDDIPCEYDLIYSAGLFDYLGHKVAVKLVQNLKKILKNGGQMLIANASDKSCNSSAAWMEWVAEWYLIYRSEDELKSIFIEAEFQPKDLSLILQKEKVMRYCLATKC
ncbi:MAG: class I SAM-dependent methyltransferase [Candidatus Omnitrophica bacterium]|nr:class I SAM-dependent methyltransferase [Candidatus Omnitrophota bacterium]